MLDIQVAGSEILNGYPRKFYIFSGTEYGIKSKYIDILADHFGKKIECSNVKSILDMMNTKHIVPLDPALYVVRYDEDFVRNVDSSTSTSIDNCSIVGTIVCIYESKKTEEKLDKYLPDFVVDISGINNKFAIKYLRQEFPHIPDDVVKRICKISSNFEHSRNICRSISKDIVDSIYPLSESDMKDLFGVSKDSSENRFRIGFVSGSFNIMLDSLNSLENKDNAFYIIFNSLLELEKLKYNSYIESDIRKYSSYWTVENIYNMFMQTYDQLKKVRKFSSDSETSLIYLISLSRFKKIPNVRSMA